MYHYDRDFVDKNSERYMFPTRIQSMAKALRDHYVLKEEIHTGDFQYAEGDYTYSELAEKAQWTHFPAGQAMWGEPDQFVWFRQTVTIPENFCGKDIWYAAYPYTQIDTWPWGQPQIQLFVNGECVCGLDNNHRRHLLIKNAQGGEQLEIAMKCYSDLTYFRGKMTMRAVLQVIRPEVYEFHQSVVVPLQAATLMTTDNMARVEIIKKLNHAMNILDLQSDPDSTEFTESLAAADKYLKDELYGTMQNGMEPVMWGIGHTHIDVAWQWTYHITRNKTARSFATNLRLLDNNPDYLFMSSQAQLYDFLKQDEPALYEQVRQRVKEGRWEPEGGMWVEADTNLTSGESLVRQFLFGKRFFKKEFGVDNEILWLPDVFGYSANLPQICERAGIKYFYTTKISWNEYDKFPYDTFIWRGMDGTPVLTHFGCATPFVERETDWMTTYNPTLEPSFVLGAWERYQQKDINRDLLYDYGFGDGGGGPTQEMIDYGRRFNLGIPGCPIVKFAKTNDYFHQLEKDVLSDPHLPEWDGEMYLEFHRGTYTSQAKTKKNNRKSEQLYHDVENLWSFAALTGTPTESYPAEQLNENWKIILLNQFHDVLPGSSIHQVYEDCAVLYDKVLTEGRQMQDNAVNTLASKIHTDGESIVVFNTMSFVRSPIVVYDGKITGLMDADGTLIDCQPTYDGKTVFVAKDIPAKGWKSFRIVPASAQIEDIIFASPAAIDTPLLHVEFNEKMHITSLYSKTAARETLPEGTVANRIIAYDDRARTDDAWNVQAFYREKSFPVDDVTSVEVLEAGSVRAVLRVTRKFRKSTVQTDVIAYSHLDQLFFDYDIDWHERNLFVKAEYPVDVNAQSAAYDIQFGHIHRTVNRNTLWDFGKFEVCGHKWADLSDESFGLSIINDCKYGHDASRNCLRLSLLKCSTYPDPEQDQGRHQFSYAIYPHAGNLIQARVRDRAYDFNHKAPVAHICNAQNGVLPATLSLFTLNCSNVVIETIKKAEDSNDIVVRMYEAENKQTGCTLTTAFNIESCAECNLMEEVESTLAAEANSVELHFRPCELKTIIIKCGN